MQVLKVDGGYRIELSGAEYRMLKWLVNDGIAVTDGMEGYEGHSEWEAAERAALAQRVAQHGTYGVLDVDAEVAA